jgi:hypothetical protein
MQVNCYDLCARSWWLAQPSVPLLQQQARLVVCELGSSSGPLYINPPSSCRHWHGWGTLCVHVAAKKAPAGATENWRDVSRLEEMGAVPLQRGIGAGLAGFCVVAVAVTALFVCIGRALLRLRVALRDGPLVQSMRACTFSAGERIVAYMQAFPVRYCPCTTGLEECFCDARGVVWVNAWFTSQQKAACPHSPVLVASGCLVWH